MSTFADIARGEIKYDCRFYTGYKPCHKHDGCPDCPHYVPRGEQILIIKLGAMGDVLRTKAILPALKREHPNSWVVWITAPGSEMLARDPLVDEVLSLDVEGLLSLEGREFARLICLDKDKPAVALAARVNAARKQGFAPTAYNTIGVWNDAAMYALRLGLSDDLKFFQNQKSMPAIVAEIAELDYRGEPYGLQISESAAARAAEKWNALFPQEDGEVIGLNTGCGPVFATKAWPKERMVEFLREAAQREGRRFVLLGGPREREIHQYIMRKVGGLAETRVLDAGNDNPLDVFFALVDRCDALLSADSLGMHVGIALRKPVIAWFGSTCHQEVDLFGRGEKIVSDFPCSPCYLKQCPKPVFCMDAMKPQAVAEALDRVLEKAAP